jgi:hypothetical protein
MPTFKVNRITQQQVISPNGVITSSYLVNFNVGDHGPFTIQIPADQFNAQTVRQKLTEFASNIQSITTGA